MSKKKENRSFEKATPRVEKYIFKTTYKKWSLIFKKWEIVSMSPCEAKEFEQFVYSFSPKAENCDCDK